VATLVLLELRLIASPLAGVGDRFNVRSCAEPGPATMVSPTLGVRELAPELKVTWTGALAEVKPGADAVMLTDPRLTPLTCGCVVGNVFLAAMKTLPGVTVAVELLLLASEMVTPAVGAAAARLTCSRAD
jgi:hypothetical protein